MAPKPALGLYFNDSQIHLSKLNSAGNQVDLFGQTPLPPGIVTAGEIQNETEFSRILTQLLKNTPPRPVAPDEETILAVPGNRVFLREFTVSQLAT